MHYDLVNFFPTTLMSANNTQFTRRSRTFFLRAITSKLRRLCSVFQPDAERMENFLLRRAKKKD